MPMIEFRYKKDTVPDEKAAVLGEMLEGILRKAIEKFRLTREGYGVTVEGDPFGPIAFNQPDLRIYVFYHDDWGFSQDELRRLTQGVICQLEETMKTIGLEGIKVKLRLYARSGHSSASIG